jgi:hypothetical protein
MFPEMTIVEVVKEEVATAWDRMKLEKVAELAAMLDTMREPWGFVMIVEPSVRKAAVGA